MSAEVTSSSPDVATGATLGAGTHRLIVARHGRTRWNEMGLFQGHADVPLDSEGERQAIELAAALSPLHPERLVSSDLTRARQTATPLAAATGLHLHTDSRLREVDVGAWEGLTRDGAAARYPDDFRAWAAGEDRPRGGGETRAEGGQRAADAIISHLNVVGPDHLVVVVSHGLVLRAAVDQLAARGLVETEVPTPSFPNAAWRELLVERKTV